MCVPKYAAEMKEFFDFYLIVHDFKLNESLTLVLDYDQTLKVDNLEKY